MTGNDLREKFLAFFESKDHLRYPSGSLIPDDPTTLLTSAGMQPFVPYFMGLSEPPRRRMTTSQKCCRADDIEEVGITWRHATFFEMLGNFSFGDYFKREAIEWGWEFVTEVLQIPVDDLWATVYLDDDDAHDIWVKHIGLSPDRVLRFGKADNWWGPVGEAGPCGPDSEIFYDRGPRFGCGKPDCKPGCDCDRYGELWNLVFQQYDQQPDGELKPLPAPGIDTGMGLERVACVLQDQETIFDSDLMRPIVERLAAAVAEHGDRQAVYGRNPETTLAYRIITDHLRAVTFMAAEGIMPSNEGRGYVLRRFLRRAYRYGRPLGLNAPFLHAVAPAIAKLMGEQYPELVERQAAVTEIVRTEEERFEATLARGLELLEQTLDRLQTDGATVVPGDEVFRLYDTYGFPHELTAELAAERGFALDMEGFRQRLEQQRETARSSGSFTQAVRDLGRAPRGSSEFVGYETLSAEGEIVDVVTSETGVSVVLSVTPFYGEAGGQVGDTGRLEGDGFAASVVDTTRSGDAIVHWLEIEQGEPSVGMRVTGTVDAQRRRGLRRAHTATHLLHAALRKHLGDHVTQAGSLVEPDRLRFDFSHMRPVSEDELRVIQTDVQSHVLADHPVTTAIRGFDEARKSGAMALFGEKYGDTVRVVEVPGVSMELCGGTHVDRTSVIGPCVITAETGIGANVRRVEALTGASAAAYLSERATAANRAAQLLNVSPESLVQTIERLQAEVREAHKELQRVTRKQALESADELTAGAVSVSGLQVLAVEAPSPDREAMRALAEKLAASLGDGVAVLGCAQGGKVQFVGKATAGAVEQGVHVGNLLREVAAITGGGGGGRPDFAQAGGRDPDRLADALSQVPELVSGQLQ